MTQPTKQREGDQPLPVPGRQCVQDALIAEIEQRKQLGIQRYGQPLMTHNGRDAIRDAREEAVDLAVYLMQVELEVRDLQAERDRLKAHILDIDAHATPYGDLPDDPGHTGTYLVTAGALHRALGKVGHTSPSCGAEAERDGAYRERAHLVALLAALYPAVLAPAPDVDEPGWQIAYLTLPTGQASWHIAPTDADLFEHVPQVGTDDLRARWDRHTTEEKYRRIRELSGRGGAE